MQIAIDVGYSHVKAVTPKNRIIIPSVVAPYRDLALADLSQNGTGHITEIRKVDGSKTRYFVGKLALKEGHAVGFTLDREKHKHPNHDVLVFTAARLLDVGTASTIVVGLPVAYYRSQKDELKRHLESLYAEVSVDNDTLTRISFGKVIVYPQGAGALLTAPALPDNGLALLVDVGYKTTDYVTAEIVNYMVKPVSSMCGSIEIGIYTVHEMIAQEFQVRTGSPLSALMVPEILSEGKIVYYGREMDFSDVIEKTRADIARTIADQVKAALGKRFAFIRRVYLAGGGVKALPELTNHFPVAEILPDPQWANADGFLKVISGSNKPA